MPRSLICRMMLKFSFTNSGDRPSDGSSISSSFGARIRPRPIDTIACSPPDMVPASCVRRSASRGKMLQDFGHTRRGDAVRGFLIGAEPQVLLDGELGKHLAALGNAGDAGGDHLVRRQAA